MQTKINNGNIIDESYQNFKKVKNPNEKNENPDIIIDDHSESDQVSVFSPIKRKNSIDSMSICGSQVETQSQTSESSFFFSYPGQNSKFASSNDIVQVSEKKVEQSNKNVSYFAGAEEYFRKLMPEKFIDYTKTRNYLHKSKITLININRKKSYYNKKNKVSNYINQNNRTNPYMNQCYFYFPFGFMINPFYLNNNNIQYFLKNQNLFSLNQNRPDLNNVKEVEQNKEKKEKKNEDKDEEKYTEEKKESKEEKNKDNNVQDKEEEKDELNQPNQAQDTEYSYSTYRNSYKNYHRKKYHYYNSNYRKNNYNYNYNNNQSSNNNNNRNKFNDNYYSKNNDYYLNEDYPEERRKNFNKKRRYQKPYENGY